MKSLRNKCCIFLLLIVIFLLLNILINISLNSTTKKSLTGICLKYSSIEIADRGYSNTYNGPGGQIITIDISGSSENQNNNTDNTSNSTNTNTNSQTPPPQTNNQTSQNQTVQNNNSQNNSNGSGVSFGSSTSTSSETTPTVTKPTQNTNDQETTPDQNNSSENPFSQGSDIVLDFKSAAATVKVKADNDINSNLTLRSNKLLLNFSLQKQIDGDNEFFELYFVNGKNEKVELPEKNFSLNVKINENREFLGFYEVVDDSSLKALNYYKTSDSSLEFETTKLGKYVICYKAEENIDDTKENNNDISQIENQPTFEKKDNSSYIWIVLGISLCVVVVFAIAAIIILKKFVL